MVSKTYEMEISAITAEIEKQGDVWELYYQRGYYYFLADNEVEAVSDYKRAAELGLDFTKVPYYCFSDSNSKRREFLLPEKIMVFLILLIVFVALFYQVFDFVMKIKDAL